MTDRIKAIETMFRGIKYRSRTEARWAVFLDEIRVPFAYEPEGFDLDGDWYLPDFWLPTPGVWLEVKGLPPTDRELRVAKALAKASRCPVLIAVGQPGPDFNIIAIGASRAPIKVAFTGDGGSHVFISSECQNVMLAVRGDASEYGGMPYPIDDAARIAAAERFGVHNGR